MRRAGSAGLMASDDLRDLPGVAPEGLAAVEAQGGAGDECGGRGGQEDDGGGDLLDRAGALERGLADAAGDDLGRVAVGGRRADHAGSDGVDQDAELRSE